MAPRFSVSQMDLQNVLGSTPRASSSQTQMWTLVDFTKGAGT